MRRELPDRLPVDMIWPRSETMRALKDHFGVDSMDAVRDRLGVDFVWSEVGVEYTAYRNRCNGTLTGDAPGAGRPYIFHDPMTFENEWGVIHRVGADGKYLQWVSGPLVGKESLDGWRLPEMRLDSIETTRRRFARYPDRIVVAELANSFKTAWQLCGFNHFMTLMALNPGFVDELFEHLFVHETEKAVIAARAAGRPPWTSIIPAEERCLPD